MKERPILFSAPMVRALLEGRKNQTRRVVKPHPVEEHDAGGRPVWVWKQNGAECPRWSAAEGIRWERFGCPYGQPGDRLWVRETWAPCEAPIRLKHFQYAADGAVGHEWSSNGGERGWARSGHTVGLSDTSLEGVWVGKPSRWRPSIHMPRWASRITLEVVEVRVERLNEISAKDALAEGIEERSGGDIPVYAWPGTPETFTDPREAFERGWNELHKERSNRWVRSGELCASPWVWCIGFKRVEQQKARGAA